MFVHRGVNVVELTKDFVDYFSQLPHYKGDRDRESPKGAARVQWLENKLSDGRFYTPSWATAELAGVKYRVNGGHSSLMLANAPAALWRLAPKHAVISEFVCSSDLDMAELFSEFDEPLSVRSQYDKVTAHKAVYSDFDNISASAIEKSIRGIAWYYRGTEDLSVSRDEQVRFVHHHKDFIVAVDRYIGTRHMTRAGVQAAMFATFLYHGNSEAFHEFWGNVTTEAHPDNKHPTRVLASFLKTTLGKSVGGTSQQKWDVRAFYVKCIHAWNATREGKRTDLKYHQGSKLPRVA